MTSTISKLVKPLTTRANNPAASLPKSQNRAYLIKQVRRSVHDALALTLVVRERFTPHNVRAGEHEMKEQISMLYSMLHECRSQSIYGLWNEIKARPILTWESYELVQTHEHAVLTFFLLDHDRLEEAISSAGAANMWAGCYSGDLSAPMRIGSSTRDAAILLAAASRVAAIERQSIFERRFRQLGMSKNNAAAILSNEFGISQETARKKLQGVDAGVPDHGKHR